MAVGRQGKRCEDWRTMGHLPLLRQASRTSRCPRVPVLVQSAELVGSAVQGARVGGAVRAILQRTAAVGNKKGLSPGAMPPRPGPRGQVAPRLRPHPVTAVSNAIYADPRRCGRFVSGSAGRDELVAGHVLLGRTACRLSHSLSEGCSVLPTRSQLYRPARDLERSSRTACARETPPFDSYGRSIRPGGDPASPRRKRAAQLGPSCRRTP